MTEISRTSRAGSTTGTSQEAPTSSPSAPRRAPSAPQGDVVTRGRGPRSPSAPASPGRTNVLESLATKASEVGGAALRAVKEYGPGAAVGYTAGTGVGLVILGAMSATPPGAVAAALVLGTSAALGTGAGIAAHKQINEFGSNVYKAVFGD